MLADINAAAIVAATFFGFAHALNNSRGLFADHEIRYTVPSPYLHHVTATEMPMPHYTSTRTIKRIVYTTIHLPYTEVGHPVQGVPTHVAVPSHDQILMEVDHAEMLRQHREHYDLRRRNGIMDPPLPAYDVLSTSVHGPKPTGEPCALGQTDCIAAPGAVSLVGDIVDGIKSKASPTVTTKTGTRAVPAATSPARSAIRESANAGEAVAGSGKGFSRVAFLVAVAVAVVGGGFA